MLAIPYMTLVDVLLFDTKGHQYARRLPFGCVLYNTYSMNNNSECLFVGAPHKHYKDFRKAFEK